MFKNYLSTGHEFMITGITLQLIIFEIECYTAKFYSNHAGKSRKLFIFELTEIFVIAYGTERSKNGR